jgi:hypothetical protein
MTDTVDLLIRARFDAVANSIDARDWNDVLLRLRNVPPIDGKPSARRTAHRRIPRRVVLAAAVVAALAVAVTAVAFGWPQTFIDFFSSPPAPTHIKNSFGAQNVTAPPGMNPQAIPGQARKIMSARFDESGRHYDHPALHTLYVAPRKGGGFCYEWTNADGGCAPAKSVPTNAHLRAAGPLGITWSTTNDSYPLVVDGWVRAGAARSVEARFGDRTVAPVTIPITWVSAPINAGFFVYAVPPGHRNRGDALRSVVAVDANGNVIGTESFPVTKPLYEDVLKTLPDGRKVMLERGADAAEAREIISFRATDGSHVYLWVMPRTGGGDCYVFSQGGGCRIPRFDRREPAFLGGLSAGSSRVLFFGQAKPEVSAVELRYQNGDAERLTPVDGFVLHEITPAHYRRGTRLVAAVALDRAGKAILTQHIRPQVAGVYPCKKPVDLGYGAHICP